MRAYGLQSHIWNNNLKSMLLLAGFPILLALMFFALILLVVGAGGQYSSVQSAMPAAAQTLGQYWFFPVGIAGLWFLIAWFGHQKMIELSTKSRGLTRKEAPEIYNMLENLCIERGETPPKLNIIETPAMNAFASGLRESQYTVTLTRGIIERLDPAELRAVIAHELSHIRNRDVRLLIISVIFVGIFSFVGEMLFRSMFRTGRWTGGYSRGRNGDSRGGGVIILAAIAIVAVSYILALVIRFAISRKREYLADAGAVDLTKDPDAMISALQKISGHSDMDAPNDVQQMCIDNDNAFAGIFMTHPPIEKRIKALVEYAGGAV